MRIGKIWSAGLAGLLALAVVARAQDGGERRGPTAGAKAAAATCGSTSWMWRAGSRRCSSRPRGESLLVDTGSPDARNPNAPRDASRIAAVCKLAGVTKIDNLLITHYHSDHVGGLPQLVGMIPVGRFIDHGREPRNRRCAGRRVDDCRAITRTRRCWPTAMRTI